MSASRLAALAALPLAVAAAVLTAGPADASVAGLPSVRICKDVQFQGGCWESRQAGYQNFSDARGTGYLNDTASSISVDPGCTLWVYSDYDKWGRFQTWSAARGSGGNGDDDLTSSWVGNDTISGVSINCGA